MGVPSRKDETMNNTLKAFAQRTLKDGLARCTEEQRVVFKLMYSEPTDPRHRTPNVVARIKAADIEHVVDSISDEKVDWAMAQVEATLAKAAKDAND